MKLNPEEEAVQSWLSIHKLKALFESSNKRSPLKVLPLLDTLKTYKKSDLKKDIKSGFNVALLDFPQGMAYALIAGLPFYMGIYASAIAAFIGPFFASSRFVMLGPSNAIAVLTMSSFLGLHLSQNEIISAIPLMLLMISVFMLIGGLLRIATLMNYVSRTVVTGYITAAAFLIIIKQTKNVLELEFPKTDTVISSLINTLQQLPNAHLPALLMGLLTIVTYYGIKKFLPKLPQVALTLVLMSLAAHIFAHYGYDLKPLSNLSMETGHWILPTPTFSFDLMSQLSGPALAIAFLSILESSSIAKTLAARSGDTVNVNQQMISMSAANAGCALLGGMPISGSLTRSMLNFNSGAQTPIASIVSSCGLTIGILLLAPYMVQIPIAALSSLVILIGISLINKKNIRMAIGTTPQDALVYMTTFIAGLLFPLDNAIYLGVGMSVFLFLRKAGAPDMMQYSFNQNDPSKEDPSSPRSSIALLHVEGDLFFGSSDMFLEQARHVTSDPNLKAIILRLRNAHNLDATCAMAIEQLAIYAKEKNRFFIISGAHKEVVEILRSSGLLSSIGRENVFCEDPDNPTLSTSMALKRARQLAGSDLDLKLFIKEKEEGNASEN